jgi:hypothetical protein
MANTLRFKRGLAAGIPTGVAGEPLFTTDTFDLYIGNGTTNTRFQKYIASGTTSQYLRGDGSLATFPSLTGFVPYTGATANVDLGTHTILAQNATIASSGSGNTATITHSSGSGIALNITKGGNNEGLYINKTSGSGNAATIIGTLNATSLVKSGGTSTQYLMADGTTSTLTNPITGSGAAGQVAYFTGATTQAGSNNLFWDNTNGRLGIGTNTPTVPLDVVGSLRVSASSSSFVNSAGSNIVTIQSVPNGTNATLRLTSPANSWDISNGGASAILTFTRGTTQLGAWYNTGNLILQNGGTFTDSGQRLQVTGDTLLKGSGNTSGTTALTVQNSDGVNLLKARNDGAIQIGSRTSEENYIAGYTSTSPFGAGQRTLAFVWGTGSGSRPNPAFYFTSANNINYTSTSGDFIQTSFTFNPTSGTGAINTYLIQPTINQTGGANGITRGLYVNPNLVAAADWRSIEWSNNTGWGLYGAGTSNNYLGGSLGINSTALTAYSLRVEKNLTGGTTAFGVYLGGQINSDVTSTAYLFRTRAFTQAASFTLGFLIHYSASNSGLGAGSSITNQYGFIAESGLTQATNNYGFYGGITAATGRWNFYADGTALNYMNGPLLLGSTTSSGEKLQVTGTAKITGASSFGGNMAVGTSTATERLHLVDTTNGFVGLRLEGTGTYAGSDFIIYASSTTPSSANDFFGIYNNSATDGATVGYKMQIFKSGAATFASSITSTSLSTGVGTFSGNSIITLNQNGATRLSISNTTSGTGSFAETSYISNSTSGQLQVGKLSSLYSGYKTNLANDAYIYNNNIAGNISILNDFASGNINFAAGGSSTAQMTLASTGALTVVGATTIGTTSTTGYSLVVQNSGASDTTGIRLTSGGTDNGYFITAYNAVSKYASLQAGDNAAYRAIILNALGGNVGIGVTPTYKLHVQGTGFFSDNVRFPNLKGLIFVQTGGTLLGSISMDSGNAVTIDNNGFFGLSVGTDYTKTGGNLGIGHNGFGTSATRTISVLNGTAPSTSPADSFQMYSNDVVAGNAAAHFRTENGAVIKLYQETTSVGNATISVGGGSAVLDDTEFDGYTLRQIVKALRNQGILA